MIKFIGFCLVLWFLVSLFRKKPSKRSKQSQGQSDYEGDVKISIRYGDFDDDFTETQSDADCWVEPGRTVKVKGRTIDGGMIYLGDGLGSVSGYGPEPALINPGLKVAADVSCANSYNLHYWPSYHTISAHGRSAYLNWLSSGRRDPDAYIGYVFLFYYGLERQVLHAKCSEETLLAIKGEVRELHVVYGENRSFRGYSECFLGLLDCLAGDYAHVPQINPTKLARGMYPASFKVALGTCVAEKKPIPWKLALEWVLRDYETRLRVPAKRCPNEFAEFFRVLYERKYGAGMVVPPNKKKVQLSYHPASSGLRQYSAMLDIPDPSELKRPRATLRKIVEESMSGLDAFSRLKGKDQKAAQGMAGLALLPHDLVQPRAAEGLKELRQFCDNAMRGGAMGKGAASDLIDLWPTKTPGKMNRAEAKQVMGLMARVGVGVEPDPRFGGRTPVAGDDLVLFKLPEGDEVEPGTGFQQALALVHLSGLVAAADGEVSPEERKALEDHLAASLGLSKLETLRLSAFFEWIVGRSPSLAGMKAKMSGLGSAQREKVADFLIGVAGADGTISPDEVKILERIYKTIGLDAGDVQTRIHRFLANGNVQPVTVRPADKRERDFIIPARPEQDVEGIVRLDPAKLQAKRDQTKEVSDILQDVFVDDEPEEELVVESEGLVGFDGQHRQLLVALSQQEEWERDAYNALAEKFGLMPSGALEALNDIALENFDDDVLFDEECVVVNKEVVEEMLA